MVSEMAMEDLAAMKAEGIEVPVRDAVRLNAFGLKVEHASHAADFHVMPRVAFLGDVALREPTISDDLWLNRAAAVFDLLNAQTLLFLRAVSLSTAREDLPSPTDREAVMAAVAAFCEGPAGAYTIRQLGEAVRYAVCGNDAGEMEEAPAGKDAGKDAGEALPEEDAAEPAWLAGVIRDAVAFRLGSVEEVSSLTRSQLVALVAYMQEVKYGDGYRKSSHSDALAAYLRVKDEIRANASKPAEQDAEHEHEEDQARNGEPEHERGTAERGAVSSGVE